MEDKVLSDQIDKITDSLIVAEIRYGLGILNVRCNTEDNVAELLKITYGIEREQIRTLVAKHIAPGLMNFMKELSVLMMDGIKDKVPDVGIQVIDRIALKKEKMN